MERHEKPVGWIGSSYKDLCGFPVAARRKAGHELLQVQKGLTPSDWKPMSSIGPGTYEIRIRTEEHGGSVQYRVFYVGKFEEAVWVLHAFQKTTNRTSRRDIEIGKKRYGLMLRQRMELETFHGE